MHRAYTACAQTVHRFGAYAILSLTLVACSDAALFGSDSSLLRNPTVPIGAISRFDPALFDGRWDVVDTAGGAWDLRSFEVASASTEWRDTSAGAITQLAPGIFKIDYANGASRTLWIVWIDPDHQTAAIGDPDGRFGFVATRPGRARADQVEAARQVLDFNGYRTKDWKGMP